MYKVSTIIYTMQIKYHSKSNICNIKKCIKHLFKVYNALDQSLHLFKVYNALNQSLHLFKVYNALNQSLHLFKVYNALN